MTTRRKFIATTALTGVAAATSGTFAAAQTAPKPGQHYRPPIKLGLGGVAIGNGFKVTPDAEADEALEAAWDAGFRYFDTSPFYGMGLSERRFGHFLDDKKPEDYTISTKIGRLLVPDRSSENGLWKGTLNFKYKYDYSAAGARRSVEDSLQRLGIPSIDIVFIHDLSPDNGDMKENWTEYFETAAKGAMPELSKMRDEGLIKGWGMGVNTPQPILKALEVADPDIFLAATQYSLMEHEKALTGLFPAIEKSGTSLIIGAPLNFGFLAGRDRFNYGSTIPDGYLEKREKMSAIAKEHGTDLRTAALQFTAAPAVVSATIPGARTAEQARQNAASLEAGIPVEFWAALKKANLIAQDTPEPG